MQGSWGRVAGRGGWTRGGPGRGLFGRGEGGEGGEGRCDGQGRAGQGSSQVQMSGGSKEQLRDRRQSHGRTGRGGRVNESKVGARAVGDYGIVARGGQQKRVMAAVARVGGKRWAVRGMVGWRDGRRVGGWWWLGREWMCGDAKGWMRSTSPQPWPGRSLGARPCVAASIGRRAGRRQARKAGTPCALTHPPAHSLTHSGQHRARQPERPPCMHNTTTIATINTASTQHHHHHHRHHHHHHDHLHRGRQHHAPARCRRAVASGCGGQ